MSKSTNTSALTQVKAALKGRGQVGNKNKKYGRNRKSCGVYSLQNKWFKNKLKRLARHAKNHPNDRQTEGAVKRAYLKAA